MERKMILLSAPNDCGKSSALRSLIKIIEWESLTLLDKNYKSVDTKILDQYEDMVAIGSIKNLSQDIKIGIATLGDGARYVKFNLNFFDTY